MYNVLPVKRMRPPRCTAVLSRGASPSERGRGGKEKGKRVGEEESEGERGRANDRLKSGIS
jgi:hypothetical protein